MASALPSYRHGEGHQCHFFKERPVSPICLLNCSTSTNKSTDAWYCIILISVQFQMYTRSLFKHHCFIIKHYYKILGPLCTIKYPSEQAPWANVGYLCNTDKWLQGLSAAGTRSCSTSVFLRSHSGQGLWHWITPRVKLWSPVALNWDNYSQWPGWRRTRTNTPSKQTSVFGELLCCTVKINISVHPVVLEDEEK